MSFIVQVGEERSHFATVPVSHLQDSEGMLDFLPGERLKFITVTIVDNPVPELDKIFRVELFDTDGGGENVLSKLMMVVVCVTFDTFHVLGPSS